MQLMREGDEWELYIPSALGYGDAGAVNRTDRNLSDHLERLTWTRSDPMRAPTLVWRGAGSSWETWAASEPSRPPERCRQRRLRSAPS